ncbi:MAG: hypothetical protein H0V66_15950, partial [Bdellovibrionales bacterium]|nr:hypothetical protein [Bdellovibrionales bacterium]
TSAFNEYFKKYKEKKLVEKFGASHGELSESERASFLAGMENDRQDLFIRFSRTIETLRSHSFTLLKQDENGPANWQAKINLDIDRIKLDKLLRKIVKGETKPFSKVILVTEIDAFDFTWPDLGLEDEQKFTSPVNESWIKWLNENIPSSVEEIVQCDLECMIFYKKWSETQLSELSIPDDYNNSVFLKVNMHLKRKIDPANVQEITFEWDGRTLLHDLATKRILGSYVLPQEKRTFRQVEQKALNSGLASSLYRSPLTAFMQFNKKLEEKIGFNRVAKLVIKGHKHLGDVHILTDLLKTRGSSLGLEVVLDNFSKEEANLLCFYRGEEKSFTDMLAGLKEVKSTHSYTLVNEFTGVHHVIKFVAE